MAKRCLSGLQFDLGYLALLTRYGIKRLSRWEGRLAPAQFANLCDLGLEVAEVRRRLLLGRRTYETVFSRNARWTDLYISRFDTTPIRETPEAVRLKGFLFGYPSCCVEAFIRRPYSRNELSPRDREILFHWACRDCRVTPQLVKEYRSVYTECVRLYGGIEPDRAGRLHHKRDAVPADLARALRRRALPATIGLSALFLLPGVAYPDPDPHLLPVEDDADQDYLSYAEEMLLGMNPLNPDVDGDSELDGIGQAHLIKDLIDSLPRYEYDDPDLPTDRLYAVEWAMAGVIECAVCGDWINMGFITIHNPMRGMQVDVPYMSLHFLEHASLSSSYIWWPSEDPEEYRIDLAALKRVLLAGDEAHLKCDELVLDPDADGLNSDEESFLATDPAVADTDGDLVKDGPQFLEDLPAILGGLPRVECDDQPYLTETRFRGVETCEVCGATFNMGFANIVNPVEGVSLTVPFVGLHYLAHGSSVYEGSVNQGRVLPILLRTVLSGDGSAHWLEIDNDGDCDGLRDEEESYFSLNPALTDTDGDGVPDGPQLATLMHGIIEDLPEGPLPDTTYVVHNLTWGVYQCLICGEDINMGYMDIVNPQTGKSVAVPYYNLHFMSKGSFSTDRPELYGRIDPRDIDDVIDVSSHASAPGRPAALAPMLICPNPFKSSTKIICNLSGNESADLNIYDVSGRKVKDLSRVFKAGEEMVWDGSDSAGRKLPPGTYFCKLKTDDYTFSRKIVLVE